MDKILNVLKSAKVYVTANITIWLWDTVHTILTALNEPEAMHD